LLHQVLSVSSPDSCNLLGTGALLGAKSNDLSKADLGSELEGGVSSLGHCFVQGDNAKIAMNSVENGIGTPCNYDSDCFHGRPFFK
jgi:hypothetical protein